MSKNFKNIALIVAAGSGTRLSQDLPKQYLKINNKTLLEITINKFLAHQDIDAVAVVISENQVDFFQQYISTHSQLLKPAYGGKRRQDSVRLGLDYIEQFKPEKVLIHDAARIFVQQDDISRTLKALLDKQAACLVTKTTDTMRNIDNNKSHIVPRKTLYKAQTPQAFNYELIKNLHRQFEDKDVTDDIALMEKSNNYDIEYIDSSPLNFKVTTEEDYKLAKKIMATEEKVKTAMGFDAHKFKESANSDNHIMLCGVAIPCKYEIVAHSDGDVALHALTDAMLGTISEGDIGSHFPPSDQKWKGAASDQFVKHARDLLKQKNGRINNIDLTIICETPKVGKFRDQMRMQIANILEIPIEDVSIKATTTEGMGFTGRREGIACNALVSVVLQYQY